MVYFSEMCRFFINPACKSFSWEMISASTVIVRSTFKSSMYLILLSIAICVFLGTRLCGPVD